jgi:hypothetical protein
VEEGVTAYSFVGEEDFGREGESDHKSVPEKIS